MAQDQEIYATADAAAAATDDKCECRYRQRKGFSKAASGSQPALCPSASGPPPLPPPRAPALDNPDIKDVLPFPARSSNNKPEKCSGPKMLQISFSHISIHHNGTDRVELPVGSGILSEKAMRDPRYEWTKTQSGLAGGGRPARVGVGHDAPSTIETIETER